MLKGLAIATVLAFALAFASRSPGWMGFGIAVGLVCGVAAALIFIDRHVRANSRPEHMTQGEIDALRNAAGNRKPPARDAPQLPHH